MKALAEADFFSGGHKSITWLNCLEKNGKAASAQFSTRSKKKVHVSLGFHSKVLVAFVFRKLALISDG